MTDITERNRPFETPYAFAFVALLSVAAVWWPAALVPAAMLALVLVLLPMAGSMVVLFGAFLFAATVPFSDIPIDAGLFKIYGADFILPFLIWGGLYLTLISDKDGLQRSERGLFVLLMLFCMYGLFSAFLGFERGHPYDQILGWYRRLYFYALAFVLPLIVPLRRTHINQFKYMIVAGGLLTLALVSYRLVTRTPLHEEVNLAIGHASVRMMSVSEYCIGAMFLAYAVAVLRINRGATPKLVALGLTGFTAAVLFLSGYRLGMLYAAGIPFLTVVLLFWIRRERLGGVLYATLWTAAAAIPALLVLAFVFSDQVEKALFDLRVRQQEIALVGDYRIWIWTEVLRQAGERPLAGAGLGHDLVFLSRTRAGFFEHKSASAHSTIMSILNQSGLIGASLFVVFHAVFMTYVVRRIRAIPAAYHAVAVALVCGYLATMAASSVEPLRVAGYVALYFVMGLIVRLLREAEHTPAENGT